MIIKSEFIRMTMDDMLDIISKNLKEKYTSITDVGINEVNNEESPDKTYKVFIKIQANDFEEIKNMCNELYKGWHQVITINDDGSTSTIEDIFNVSQEFGEDILFQVGFDEFIYLLKNTLNFEVKLIKYDEDFVYLFPNLSFEKK